MSDRFNFRQMYATFPSGTARAPIASQMVEIIWDAGRQGTATSAAGATITVGERAPFTPDDLLATAAASCFMRTLLRLAEDRGARLLSYACTATATPACELGAAPHIDIRAFVLSDDPQSEKELSALGAAARLVSPILHLLGEHVDLRYQVQCLCARSVAV